MTSRIGNQIFARTCISAYATPYQKLAHEGITQVLIRGCFTLTKFGNTINEHYVGLAQP
jgi:hypothetical protein